MAASNLSSTTSSDITVEGDLTVGGDLTVTGAQVLAGDVTLGDAASDDITITGSIAGGAIVGKKEVALRIDIADSTTTDTVGAALTIAGAAGGATNAAGGACNVVGGAGVGTGDGAAGTLAGGAAGATGDGGPVTVTSGAGGSSSGASGALTVNCGAVTSGTLGTLSLGTANTLAVDIGTTAKATTVKGTLNVDEAVTLDTTCDVAGALTSDALDRVDAGALSIGIATATSIDIGVTATMATFKGTVNVDEAVTLDSTCDVAGALTADGLDRVDAGALAIGAATATSLDIGKTGQMTTNKGTLNVDEAVTLDSTCDVAGALTADGLDRIDAGALAIGAATATSLDIGKTGQATTNKGTFNCDEAATFDTTLAVTGDITAGGGRLMAFSFTKTNMSGTATDTFSARGGATSNGDEYVMPWAGSVMAISAALNDARTAGSAIFKPTIDGTAVTTLSTTIDDSPTQYGSTTQAKDVDTFAANARLGCESVNSGWTPTTADAIAVIVVEM